MCSRLPEPRLLKRRAAYGLATAYYLHGAAVARVRSQAPAVAE
jgi:hypothetical protein